MEFGFVVDILLGCGEVKTIVPLLFLYIKHICFKIVVAVGATGVNKGTPLLTWHYKETLTTITDKNTHNYT